MTSSPEPRRYSDLSLKDLVRLCAGPRDDDAWEEFVLRVGKPISRTVIRTAWLWGEDSPCVVEELVQETYLKLWKGGCRLLLDFAIKHPDPEAILGYIRRTAANVTHDRFRPRIPYVLPIDIDPPAGPTVDGSEERIAFEVLLNEIDEHLKHCLTEPHQERDWTIFWLYFRQGMSCEEIASLPTIGLAPRALGASSNG